MFVKSKSAAAFFIMLLAELNLQHNPPSQLSSSHSHSHSISLLSQPTPYHTPEVLTSWALINFIFTPTLQKEQHQQLPQLPPLSQSLSTPQRDIVVTPPVVNTSGCCCIRWWHNNNNYFLSLSVCLFHLVCLVCLLAWRANDISVFVFFSHLITQRDILLLYYIPSPPPHKHFACSIPVQASIFA